MTKTLYDWKGVAGAPLPPEFSQSDLMTAANAAGIKLGPGAAILLSRSDAQWLVDQLPASAMLSGRWPDPSKVKTGSWTHLCDQRLSLGSPRNVSEPFGVLLGMNVWTDTCLASAGFFGDRSLLVKE